MIARSVRVALVDDHTLVREGLRRMLDDEPDLSVVAQATSLAEGRALLAEAGDFDAMVVDVTLPDGSGLTLVEDARACSPSLGIVVLTMHGDDETLLKALDSGASAFLPKTASVDEIAGAVRRSSVYPDVFSAAGLAAALRRGTSADRPRLSPREVQVLALLGAGDSVGQVARQLFLSESTVKTHVGHIYAKLGATNRTQAVMAAVRHNIIKVPR